MEVPFFKKKALLNQFFELQKKGEGTDQTFP